MSVTKDDVRKVARLTRIAVPEERIEPLANELSAILGWIEQLNEVDVDGIEPMTSVVDATLPMRDDDCFRMRWGVLIRAGRKGRRQCGRVRACVCRRPEAVCGNLRRRLYVLHAAHAASYGARASAATSTTRTAGIARACARSQPTPV